MTAKQVGFTRATETTDPIMSAIKLTNEDLGDMREALSVLKGLKDDFGIEVVSAGLVTSQDVNFVVEPQGDEYVARVSE